MYYRKNIDEHLKKEFDKICASETDIERIKKINRFFHLHLDVGHYSDYELLSASTSPIGVAIKDSKTGTIYSALFETTSDLLKAKASHIKFINVHISLPENIEREKTFYRFMKYDERDPLHDEVFATFDNTYRLSLVKKYPAWYRPIESGVYITLSDIQSYSTKYHAKLYDTTEFFENYDVEKASFNALVQEFIKNKEEIFNKIMAKLDD